MTAQLAAKVDPRRQTDDEGDLLREAALAQLSEGVIIATRGGEIAYVNGAAERLHGVARLDVAPENYSDVYHLLLPNGDPYPPHELPLARAVLHGETVSDAHWRIRRPDGTEILAIGTAKPVTNASGEQIGAVLTLHDDTDRHATQVALAEALEIQKTLLAEINHRVANNLTLLVSLLGFQARRAESEETKDLLLQTRARINVMSTIHHSLKETGATGTVELGTYLQGLVRDTLAALSDADRIDADCTASAKIVLPVSQAIAVALAVNEMLTNSLKYAFKGRESGRIRLRIGEADGLRGIVYEDDGVGLPADFDLASGNGLGMTIVQSLVAQLGATIEHRSADPGARFEIIF